MEAIPVNIHHKHTATNQMKDQGDILTGILHAGQINKTTTLPIITEEEWRQDTSEDCYL